MQTQNSSLAPALAERPEWIDETPDQAEDYQLGMWVNGGSVQLIEISRQEFVVLKAHLASLRGFAMEPEAKAA